MNIYHILAIALFISSLITAYYTLRVLHRQYVLFRREIDIGLVGFRNTMIAMAVMFFLGNIAPIIFYGYYTFVRAPDHVSPLTLLYVVSTAVAFLSVSYLLWTVYRIANAGTGEFVREEG